MDHFMKSPLTVFISLGLFAISLFCSSAANATLGEKADSVEKDRKALSAAKRALTAHANYQVQEIVSDANTVREFLTPDGVVFAVAWNGLTHPDLTTILGSYNGQYRKAKKSTPRKHGQRRAKVKGDDIVVETGGHMRNLQGRAYVPSLVPEGVDINEIH
jgi:hypothetical protein